MMIASTGAIEAGTDTATGRPGDAEAGLPGLPGTAFPEVLVLEHGLPFDEVERRLGLAYIGAGIRHRACAFYLQDIDARKLYATVGYPSTPKYAALRLGMSRREASDLLTAGKALVDLPLIDDAFAEGAVCWSKVRELVKVATTEHEQKWLEAAGELPIDALCLEVKLSRKGEPPRRRDDRKGLPEIRLRLNTELPPDIFAEWELLKKRLQAESNQPLAEWECLAAVMELARGALDKGGDSTSGESEVVVIHAGDRECDCEGGCAHEPLAVARPGAAGDRECDCEGGCACHGNAPATIETEDGPIPLDRITEQTLACAGLHVDLLSPDGPQGERRVPRWLRRKVFARDGFRCRCCGARHRLQAHHVIPWIEGGPTAIGNLISLCRYCHALVHAGLLRVAGDGPDTWRLVDREGRDVDGATVRCDELRAEVTGNGARRLIAREVPPSDVRGGVRGVLDVKMGSGTMCHDVKMGSGTMCHDVKMGSGTMCHDVKMGSGTMCHEPATRFDDLVGQTRLIESLRVAVQAAGKRNEPLGHTLLYGAPGLGKTTIARAVAGERGVALCRTVASYVRGVCDVAGLLSALAPGDALFIDEIHGLPRPAAEALYEAMDRRTFTLIGATTHPGEIPAPLLSRFENRELLEFYADAEIAELIRRAAGRMEVSIASDAADALAAVSRGTPRRALQLLRRVEDRAVAADAPSIDAELVAHTLERLKIDRRGLDATDRAYLRILRERGPDRPIGVGRVAGLIGVDAATLERDHEPYLFRLGLATTTPGGRIALSGRHG